MPVELGAGPFRFFIAIDIVGLRHLLHEEAMAVAMWHFMLAERTGNLALIEPEEQIVERNSVHLYEQSRDANHREYLRMKRCVSHFGL